MEAGKVNHEPVFFIVMTVYNAEKYLEKITGKHMASDIFWFWNASDEDTGPACITQELPGGDAD